MTGYKGAGGTEKGVGRLEKGFGREDKGDGGGKGREG